jgi:hypothetical protein
MAIYIKVDSCSPISTATIKGWERMRSKTLPKDCVDIDGVTPCQEDNMYNNFQTAPCRACGSNYRLLKLNSNTFVSDFIHYFAPGVPVPKIPGTPGLNH